MNMSQAVTSVFSQYVGFSGRARRSEYWYFVLFNIIGTLIIGVIENILDISILGDLWTLALLLPGLAVGVRRLHDTGRSGWWELIGLIPLVGEIILIVMFCGDSQPGTNQYGENPKGM